MARKSMKRSNSNRKQKRSKKQAGGAKKGSSKKKKSTGKTGGKLGPVDLNNYDNNKFWCMKCGREDKKTGIVQGKGVNLETTKNGRQALRGKCATCGCKVFRFC